MYHHRSWESSVHLRDLLGPLDRSGVLRSVPNLDPPPASPSSSESLYQTLDRLHPRRACMEQGLADRERTLFDVDDSLYLYDLTGRNFEGQCPSNPPAQRGDSRDSRPGCQRVVVGVGPDRDGFPKTHEVFDGNRTDRTTLGDMLHTLEARTGRTTAPRWSSITAEPSMTT